MKLKTKLTIQSLCVIFTEYIIYVAGSSDKTGNRGKPSTPRVSTNMCLITTNIAHI